MTEPKQLQNAVLVSEETLQTRLKGVTDEIDNKDYLILYPKVGLETGYTEAIVNSDFKYAIGAEASSSFSFIDRDSKHVVYYATVSTTGVPSMYKAYRYSKYEKFIFEPEPLSFTFLGSNESLAQILNIGTNFIVARIFAKTAPRQHLRTVIVKTGGSSTWADWTLAYDITSLEDAAKYANFALVQKNGKDYILRISGANSITLEVFSPAKALLRSLVVFDAVNSVDYVDRAGLGRTGLNTFFASYHGFGVLPGFTWNPFTESIHFRCATYQPIRMADGTIEGTGFSFCIAWKIPFTWIDAGSGTCTDLIPIKSNGKRYRAYPDSTWDKFDGGLYLTDSGGSTSTVTDEYTGEIHVVFRGYWGQVNAGVSRIYTYEPASPMLTYSSGVLDRVHTAFDVNIPDGSPYAKGFEPMNTFIMGNTMHVHGRSSAGIVPVQLSFFTNKFLSVVRTNDTLYVDAATIKTEPFANDPDPVKNGFNSRFCTVVRSGAAKYYVSTPSQQILEAALSGGNITWKYIPTVFPAIPTQLQGITFSFTGCYAWNGNTTSPVFYALVKTPTYYRFIRNVGGVWSFYGGNVGVAQIDNANASRGDSLYTSSIVSDNTMLTESGLFFCTFMVPVTGDTHRYCIVFNTNDGTSRVATALDLFTDKPAVYGMFNYSPAQPNHGGTTHGYCDLLGYYAVRGPLDYTNFKLISSKDPLGVGAPLTESEWYNGTKARYEITMSASSAVGLIAYLSEYPIFIGGYYTKIPQTTVLLKPNADNYIFAIKGTGGRDDIKIVVYDSKLSNTFSRVCVAKVTTSADRVAASYVYSVDGTGLPDQENKGFHVLASNGKNAYWASLNIPDLLNRIASLESRVRALEIR